MARKKVALDFEQSLAEQKVQVLLERDGELAEEPFDAEQPE
jgi:exodeoxyribonuclease VII small subunit